MDGTQTHAPRQQRLAVVHAVLSTAHTHTQKRDALYSALNGLGNDKGDFNKEIICLEGQIHIFKSTLKAILTCPYADWRGFSCYNRSSPPPQRERKAAFPTVR